jgi:hypothetical protein
MHYACIIGVNHEWPEQRKELGDIGLARCLSHHCKLPKEHLLELYDERATRSRILYSLEQLLNVRNQNPTDDDVLLLYYGGHGKRQHACTFTRSIVDDKIQKEPWLRYDEIIDLLETHFVGGTVWVVVDCCHSGGFGEAVMQRHHNSNTSLNVSYGCIMSVPPGDEAGMEWAMTECFIKAFKGELRYSESDCSPYYLSTKKGKHRITDESVLEDSHDTLKIQQLLYPSWEQVIEYLADEMGRIKGDQLTTLFYGEKMCNETYLKRPCLFGEIYDSAIEDSGVETNHLLGSIPRDSSWMGMFVQNEYSINDEVYVKLTGSISKANNGWSEGRGIYTRALGWLRGRIISMDDNMASIRIYDIITEDSWTAIISIDKQSKVMSGLPFGFHLEPQSCVAAVTHFAKQLCYLDTSLNPFTRLRILWSDDKFYTGRVMSLGEVDWDHLKEHKDLTATGPYVPVQWEEEDTVSIVPLERCVVIDKTRESLNEQELLAIHKSQEKKTRKVAKSIKTPMDAMLASLSSSGKKLHPKKLPVIDGLDLDEQEYNEYEAYDSESKEFLPVQLLNECITKLPLEVIAAHMCYPQSGNFSVVFWEDDSVLSLVPSNFIRLRSDDSSSDSSSSCEEDECSELYEQSLANYDTPPGFSWQTASKVSTILSQLGLLTVSFGMGYLIGKKTNH